MFNTLNTVRPRPYPQKAPAGYNAGSEGADKDGHNSQGNERQQEQAQENVVARGRASEVAQAQPIQPMMGNAYQNATRPYPASYHPSGINNPAYRGNTQINPMQYQAAANSSYTPVGGPAAQTPLNAKSNKVNIAQIIKDFRNTMKAIATPKEVEAEVDKYLQIVNQQVKAPNPQINLIQSNLKFAASLLDKYISETLNKESKVVQNWLDALFLQRIDYNYNENDVNPNFLVQFAQDGEGQKSALQQTPPAENEINPTAIADEQTVSADIPAENPIEEYVPPTVEEEYTVAKEKFVKRPNITIIPQDTRLKSLFLEAKKQAFSNNPQKAMSIFKEAFNRASELKDNETQSRICLEIGKIYDDNDFVVQALTSYNKSLEYTTDTNVKSRAHYSMAQIYDDVNQTGAALDHYITSIAYACKSDDLVSQSDSLTRVANIYADQYNEGAFDYYDIARKLSEQTNDFNVKGYVLSNTADACVQFRKNDKALKYYAEAVKNYEKIGSAEEIAENYKSAAELMISYNNNAKARSLLKKSMINAVKTDNEDLISEINLLLSSIEE